MRGDAGGGGRAGKASSSPPRHRRVATVVRGGDEISSYNRWRDHDATNAAPSPSPTAATTGTVSIIAAAADGEATTRFPLSWKCLRSKGREHTYIHMK